MLAQEDKTMLRLAQRCFSDYLYVLVICLFFLIPKQGDTALAGELLFIGLRRALRLFRHARATTHDAAHKLVVWQPLQDYALHLFCTIGLVAVSILVYRGAVIAPYLVATIVIALAASASWNTWLLLVIEKDFAGRA